MIHRAGLGILILATALAPLACSGEHDDASVPDHHEDGSEEAIAHESSALNANDTVATAVAQSCTTTVVKGLAVQLVDEIQCLRPNTFAKIDGVAGLSLGSAVFPYLQTKAAAALIAAQKARGVTMSINSALRTLPQQYLLYRWYQTGRCGISLAASPGTSNHEGAIAVDVNDSTGWRTTLTNKGFRWLGASDPVHYDFVGGGTVDLRGLSVTAFQRLWNRNHPTDKIAEDGDYGDATAAKLASSPANGFAKGAQCMDAADAGADASAPTTGTATVTGAPGVTAAGAGAGAAGGAHDGEQGAASGGAQDDGESSGCAIGTPRGAGGAGGGGLGAIAIAAAAAGVMTARRRLRGSEARADEDEEGER